MNGTEKEIDKLGRIVIPMKIRNKLGLKEKSKVIIELDGEYIIVSSKEKICAICGSDSEVNSKIRLCRACIRSVKNLDSTE